MKVMFNGQRYMLELHASKENANGAKAYARKQTINSRDRQILIRDYIQRCHEEGHEMAEAHSLNQMDEANLEMIDTLSFVTSLSILCGVEGINVDYVSKCIPAVHLEEFMRRFNNNLYLIAREIPAKPWKTKRPKVNEERLNQVCQELWALCYCFAATYIPDVEELYRVKFKEVQERLNGNY